MCLFLYFPRDIHPYSRNHRDIYFRWLLTQTDASNAPLYRIARLADEEKSAPSYQTAVCLYNYALPITIYSMTKKPYSLKLNALSTIMFAVILVLMMVGNIRKPVNVKKTKK